MSIESEAKMEVIEEIVKMVEEKGGDGMAVLAISMQTMMAIDEYQKKLAEKTPDLSGLVEALADGGFTDENGTALTDTFTFKQLQNKTKKKAE